MFFLRKSDIGMQLIARKYLKFLLDLKSTKPNNSCPNISKWYKNILNVFAKKALSCIPEDRGMIDQLYLSIYHTIWGGGIPLKKQSNAKGRSMRKHWNFIVSIKILSIITIWTCSVQIIFQRQDSLNELHAVPQLRHLFELSGFFGLDFTFQKFTLTYDNFSFFFSKFSHEIIKHAKNVWCCGEGYFGQKKLRKKCVNRDKSA